MNDQRPSEEARSGRPGSRDLFPLAALAAALYLATCSVLLWHQDFISNYPFFGGDSFDYLCNALHYLGYDVPFSVRPPLLPTLAALLDRTVSWSALPLFLAGSQAAAALALFVAGRRLTSEGFALTCMLSFLACDAANLFALTLDGVSLGASLLFVSVVLFDSDRPVAAGTLAGLSFVAHQLALLFLPAVAATLLLRGRATRRRLALQALAAFAPWAGAYWLLRLRLLGTVGDGSLRHWSLISPDLDGLLAYAVFLPSAVGAPLLLAGSGALLWDLSHDRRLSPLAWILPGAVLAFFTVVYDWHAHRFVAYLIPFVYLWLCAGWPVAPKAWHRAAAALALATAALPTAAGLMGQARVWLAPGLHLDVPLRSDQGSILVTLEELRSVSTGPSRPTTFGRIWRADQRRTRIAPSPLEGPALFLYGEQRPELYAAQTRLAAQHRTQFRVGPGALFRALTREDELRGEGRTANLFRYSFESPWLERPWTILSDHALRLRPPSTAPRPTWLSSAEGPLALLVEQGESLHAEALFAAPSTTLFLLAAEASAAR
ncbi:MAG: hypothetical protein AAF690_21810, partial [Acidobacteriota bacterium]